MDTKESGSRIRAARTISALMSSGKVGPSDALIAVPVEPAPYSCPPLNFAAHRVVLADEAALAKMDEPCLLVHFDDRTDRAPIGWANKNFEIRTHDAKTWTPPLELDDD